MSKKVTMQQIADTLGVSKFVVSKALSGKPGVSETTRDRVIHAATQLGYFTQKNAYIKTARVVPLPKERVGKQSALVLMPNIRFQTRESLYWGRILDGVAAALEERGYGIIIVSEQSVDHFAHFLNPNGILGLIGIGEMSSCLLLEAHRTGLPMVLIDHEDGLIPCDTIFANNYECAYRMTKYLIGIGHRKLMFVGDIGYSRSFYDRFLGFRSAWEETFRATGRHHAADELLLSVEGLEHAQFEQAISQWMLRRVKTKPMPTAFVCANDQIAIGAVRAAQRYGMSVPHDVSVAGFDDIEDAARLQPPLSTVHVPKEALGRRAVERLLKRIEGREEPFEKILLTSELLLRDTTSQAP